MFLVCAWVHFICFSLHLYIFMLGIVCWAVADIYLCTFITFFLRCPMKYNVAAVQGEVTCAQQTYCQSLFGGVGSTQLLKNMFQYLPKV